MTRNHIASALLLLLAIAGCSKEADRSQPASQPAEEQTQTASPPVQLTATDAIDAEHLARAQKLISSGVQYLLANREPEGSWSLGGAVRPAMTAMVLKALIQHPDFDASSPVAAGGFDVLLGYQHGQGASAGGIFDKREGYANYSTALGVMAMFAAKDPRFDSAIDAAVAFMKAQQIAPGAMTPDGAHITDDHPFSGGVGYGKRGRPDLSNVGMWMQAMHDAGMSGDDPAVKRALAFVSRTQNVASNERPWVAAGMRDGGFVYAPALADDITKGESKAGPAGVSGEGLRSYGSMTYVGFKSLLYADLDRDDPRVQAAVHWIAAHWRLDSNPNMPQASSLQGLYYYYHVFAKALTAWGEPTITDSAGKEHNWRHELIDTLAARVAADGSWVNDADRWHEGSPVLVTAYAVLALQEALKQ